MTWLHKCLLCLRRWSTWFADEPDDRCPFCDATGVDSWGRDR